MRVHTNSPGFQASGKAAHYRPTHAVRLVTAASLFDGHDASINIIRRMLQTAGAEVIHLGHNRSVQDVVGAAVQEDVQGVAVSCYQGGHMEFFRYLVDMLRRRDCSQVKVFGGGGGTITSAEKQQLERHGVARIYLPEEGRRLGLRGMIDEIMQACDGAPPAVEASLDGLSTLQPDNWNAVARLITAAELAQSDVEAGSRWRAIQQRLGQHEAARRIPVVGVTGTGGAGKSTLTDELLRRYLDDFPGRRVAVLSVDPSKRRSGGALLGDRIRINTLASGRVFMRSLATRGSGREISEALGDAIAVCRQAAFDLIIVETSGIGQGDSAIVDLANLSLYVMTPEYGAQSQLEKIEMLDLADLVVINKFDKPGAEDALRDVQKAYQRARECFDQPLETLPVCGALASRFDDRGTNQVYAALLQGLSQRLGHEPSGRFTDRRAVGLPVRQHVISTHRSRYLAEVAEAVRGYKRHAAQQSELAAQAWALRRAVDHLGGPALTGDTAPLPFGTAALAEAGVAERAVMEAYNAAVSALDQRSQQLLQQWPAIRERYRAKRNAYEVRGRRIEVDNYRETLSRIEVPRVALPAFEDWGNVLRWRLLENTPGRFPFTAGVFPYKREGEDPTRMFAGQGGPWQTNERLHYLSRDAAAKRLSTAFDSVTLYGEDPGRRPDIWGKVGNSGVSVAHVEDMEALYAGFDLTDSRTSVSMTINGPAPAILAFFFNTAVRQALRRQLRAAAKIDISDADCLQPEGGGYSFEQLRAMISHDAYARLVDDTVAGVRGTVQADILKEDQAQNTCIFSTEFALRMQGDIQQWFIDHGVHNFYSVSISGYHIAEAGANPISQLAFTLANGFTFLEYFRSRGMPVDRFAPNLSFFFSNGMDPEYAVIGRVARRIWAIALRQLYGASERSQMLKYHVQTSGRSLHAQEVAFNDIRTTLQALLAVYDNCNSLHTNAYDEALTTPTEESVRRALAIQLVLSKEFGVSSNDNPAQGSYLIEELTERVEEAVLNEFERLNDRGGVFGAMERVYQRSKIQQESLHYEQLKHSGQLPIVGVNTFVAAPSDQGSLQQPRPLVRCGEPQKQDQLTRLQRFHQRHKDRAPGAIERLKRAAQSGGNIFDQLMGAAEVLSLGQITHALYEVGGRYRRNM